MRRHHPGLLFLILSLAAGAVACGDGGSTDDETQEAAGRTAVPPGSDSAATRTLPAGTAISARMTEELAPAQSRVGDAFTARLEDPLVDGDGSVVVPAGAAVRGRVTGLLAPGRAGRPAALTIDFEALSFGGTSYPLQATLERAGDAERSRSGAAGAADEPRAPAGPISGQTGASAARGAPAGPAVPRGARLEGTLARDAEILIRLDRPIRVRRTD
jgi:hypothetical protein